MATLKEIRQQILDLSDEERIGLAAQAVQQVRDAIGVEDALKVFRLATRVFVSADKNCDRYEHELYVKATGDRLTFDQFYEMTNHGSDPRYVNDLLEFTSKIHEDYRVCFALFGCALMAHDGTLTVEEQDIFNRILA